MTSAPSPTFTLDGGTLAFDFANTLGDRQRPEIDKLGGYSDLAAFAGQTGILSRRQVETLAARAGDDPAAAAKALAAAIELREALYRIFSRRVVGARADARDLALVSATIAGTAARLGLDPDGSEFAWRWRGLEGSFEALLAPIAWSAAELLTGGDLARVRECDAPACTWLFLDSSRNRSRRWCSMETCGNRAKARRHYRRTRAGERSTGG